MTNWPSLVLLFLGPLFVLLVHTRAERQQKNFLLYLLKQDGLLTDLKQPKRLLGDIFAIFIVTVISQLPLYYVVFSLEAGDRQADANRTDRNTDALARAGNTDAMRESIDLRTELLKKRSAPSDGSVEDRMNAIWGRIPNLKREHLKQYANVSELDRKNAEQFELMWRPTTNYIGSEFAKWESAITAKIGKIERDGTSSYPLAVVGTGGDALVIVYRVGRCYVDLRIRPASMVNGQTSNATVILNTESARNNSGRRLVLYLSPEARIHGENLTATGDPFNLDERGIPRSDFTEFFGRIVEPLMEDFLLSVELQRAVESR